MSGEALREAAKAGDHAQLLELLKGGADPCSVDAHGLTALMHAVWNGHLECVKVLCVNQNGRDKLGQRSRSINMASTAGYAALHLATLHCPMSLECMRMLLMFGADRSLRDSHGCTPLEIALKEDKAAEAELLQSHDPADENIEAKRQVVRSKYFVQPTREPPNPAARKALFKTLPFPLAELLPRDSEKEKVPPTPPLVVHARHLKPVCEQATRQLRGRELLWCLQFVSDESEHEVVRRYNITRSAQAEFADLVRKGGEELLSNSHS